MRVQLVVKNAGKQQGMVIPVTVRQFVIGREEGCQLRPASDLISKKHCAILIATQGVFVEDFKSTNGTKVNGIVIDGRVAIKHGDSLSVGTLEFELQILADAPAQASATTAKPTAPGGPAKPVSIASPTPIPPTNKTIAALAGQVAVPPQLAAQPKPSAPAPTPKVVVATSPPNSQEPSAMDDDFAALLMDDDPVSDSKAPIMEAPTVAIPIDDGKPADDAPQGYQPYAGAPPKPIPSMSSADSAKALLDKLMRRPR